MYKLISVLSILLLSSCYYKDGCFYAPQHASCNHITYKSDFDSFQKPEVSDEQKLIDMKDCLGKYGEGIDYKKSITYVLYKKYPNENIVHEFGQCMKYKGYIYNAIY